MGIHSNKILRTAHATLAPQIPPPAFAGVDKVVRDDSTAVWPVEMTAWRKTLPTPKCTVCNDTPLPLSTLVHDTTPMSALSLTNQFLIAMPSLADPHFSQSVTYICEHNQDGALGIVINHPLDIQLGEVLQHMNIEAQTPVILNQPVFLGGPLQRERGFVIHSPIGEWDSVLKIADIGVTSSRDILEAIARGTGPKHTLIALGYAAWGPGQLEEELANNDWLNGPASARVLFDLPFNLSREQRWHAAAALSGVDLSRLSNDVGHA